MSFMSSDDCRYATQIPITEAIEYLFSGPREFKYHEQYRKATQEEARIAYDLGPDADPQILVTAMMVRREDAPVLEMKPFQRYCVLPEAWREMARDTMTTIEMNDHQERWSKDE